jgi:PAS domain S-box-containing protein
MASDYIGLDLTFPVEYLKAAVVLSLLTVWVLVGLFSYLNLYTRRRYFTLWTAAWLFYAVWLTLCIGSTGREQDTPLVLMLKQWCVSASAVFLLWGSSVFHNLKPRQLMFGLFILFLFVWSYTGAYHLEDPLHIQLPIFAIIGLSSGMTAWAFFKFRLRRGYIGAGLLAGGFFFWGLYMAGYPFIQMSRHMISAGFLVSAVLQLFIAVSMIILVLEEVRSSNKLAFQQLRSQKSEKAVLQQKVASTEERYREIFDQAHEGIIIVAADDLQILEMNQTARKLLGMQKSVLKNPSLRQFVSAAPGQESPPAAGREWFQWVKQVHQVTVVRFDGGSTQVEIDGAGVDFDGRPAFQFFVREVTERARLQQQLRQAERLSALGQMISGVAHELNNPLAVIMGYIELVLQRQGLTEQTRSDLQKVAMESQRAASLVGNFLSFARGRAPLRTAVDLNLIYRALWPIPTNCNRCSSIWSATRFRRCRTVRCPGA